MVKRLSADEYPRWDAFVRRHSFGLISQTTGWMRAIEASFPHIRGTVLVVEDRTQREIIAGVAIYTVKSWILGRRVVSVPFASFCDPLAADVETADALVAAALQLQKETRARSLELRVWRNVAVFKELKVEGPAEHLHHYIQLARSDDEILRSFAKSAVQNELGRARRAGLVVRQVNTERDLQTIYHILTETRRRLSLPQIPYRFFHQLWRELGTERTRLYLAEKGGEAAAAMFATKFGGVFTSEFSGDLRRAGTPGANQLLYWQAITDANHEGDRIFSFGRTSTKNEALITYKRRWGTIEEPLFALAHPKVQVGRSREASLLYRAARGTMRHLPKKAYQLLGSFVYHHLG